MRMLLILSAVATVFSSCALHPCGTSKETPRRSDYQFIDFKGKSHSYEIAVTKKPGAPILITHGLGGLNASTLEWARDLGNRGWKVYLPLLDSDFDMCDLIKHKSRMRRSGIWNTGALRSSGQVLFDMEALSDWISARHGDKQIVAVGNCLTGGVPLALLGRRSVKTAVLCQPALPAKTPIQAIFHLSQSKEKREAFGIPDHEMNASLRALSVNPKKHLYGFHYLNDPFAPFDKFVWLHEELSKRGIAYKFRPVVLTPARSPITKPWWERMNTTARVGLVKPHPTLSGSDEPDRTRVRTRFNQLVRP